MNTISFIIAVALGAFVAFFAFYLMMAIYSNVMTGTRYRESLAETLKSLRLNKMLVTLGLDADKHLHQESVVKIHEQIKQCLGCKNTTECDDKLKTGNLTANDLDFCENESSLKALVEKKKAA